MRPIVLATDYGVAGSYVGQIKSAIYKIAPSAKIIDLIHELPAFNPKASAYLLASLIEFIPENSVIVGVVDPGVGSSREPLIIESDGYSFIGPNNGLFSIATRNLSSISLSKITVSEKSISKTFHGRDIFAPAAANIIAKISNALEPQQHKNLVGAEWQDYLSEIIYIDHFGNAVTGIRLGGSTFDVNKKYMINDYELSYKEAFYCANKNECFWYRNSNNLLEIAANKISVDNVIDISIGTKIKAI